MPSLKKINKKNNTKKWVVGVIGLGYVGLPVALGFSKKYEVIGFDVNKKRIESLSNNQDDTGEIPSKELASSKILFTTNDKKLSGCNLIIVAVPTPISSDHVPDLSYLIKASTTLGKNISKETIIVYESTVYPGATEEVCIPVVEAESGFTVGKDFFVGYSPERINPGDHEHTFQAINKVVSAQDSQTLETIYQLYQSVIHATVFKASSIKVAEAAKILENTQRDINIALMNEVSLIFKRLGVNTYEVIEAASTKWNFAPFYPGLVGGHCIGVDPYYLIHKAKTVGYIPHFLNAAREINDHMPDYIVNSLLKELIVNKIGSKDLIITILGVTFKQNVPDIRNSKALEIAEQLHSLGLNVQVCDPYVDPVQFNKSSIVLKDIHELEKADVIILAVPHKNFTDLPESTFPTLLKNNKGLIMDIKGALTVKELNKDIVLWKL